MLIKNRWWSLAQWKERLRQKWSGSVQPTIPAPTAQHYQMTAAERWRRDHGYSQATTPAPWTEDIQKHNQTVAAEYHAEIVRRKKAFELGEYLPRFFMDSDVNPGVYDEVNWDLEMSLLPGRRVDVTKAVGVPMQPPLSEAEYEQGREIGNLARAVAATETDPITRYVGTREEVLRACNGDEARADSVFAKARELFGEPDPTGQTG